MCVYCTASFLSLFKVVFQLNIFTQTCLRYIWSLLSQIHLLNFMGIIQAEPFRLGR